MLLIFVFHPLDSDRIRLCGSYSKLLVHFMIVNGGWSSWSDYGACSVTCGLGRQTRTRACDNPSPSGGGSTCPGSSAETRECNTPNGCRK